MSVSMSKEKAKIGSLRAKDIIITAIIVIICVVSILPLYVLIVNSTRAGQDITSNGVSLIPGLNPPGLDIDRQGRVQCTDGLCQQRYYRIVHNVFDSSFLGNDRLRHSCL